MRNIILATVLTVASTMSASAALLLGSLPFAGFGVTQDAADLSTSNVFTPTSVLSDLGTGDFAAIPSLTPGGPGVLDLLNLPDYTLAFTTFGTFDASSGLVLSRNANFL